MVGNPFAFRGDNEVMELYKNIRIGTVTAVNTTDATVRVDWADKKGGNDIVPLSMPFCEQGWGIITMPRVNTIVLCSSRPYEFPLIIAFMPPTMSPTESKWADYKQISGLSNIGSGEIIIRNMIGKAKCSVCKNIYTLDKWAENMSYLDVAKTIPMELCPNPACYVNGSRTPAISYTQSNGQYGTTIDKVYKVQMGTSIYMQKDGKLSIKLNDGLDPLTDAFTDGSLIDIEFDENSNMAISGVQALTTSADSTAMTNTQGNKITMDASGNITIEVASGKYIYLGSGSAAEPVILGTQWKTWESTHTHPTGVGPSGGPIQPIPDSVFSLKAKVE